MDLFDSLESDLTEATKARDEIKTGVLRLLKSALKNYQIEVGHDLSTAEVLAVLQKEAKKRRDAIDLYQKANRTELAEAEQQELEIIDTYLPDAASEGEINQAIDDAIKQLGADDISAMGQVMGVVMAKLGARADGAQVSAAAKEKLS